jgi:RsiW-degrading membrane proteinase PrsW (M82 family)
MTLNINALIMPWFCVIGVTIIYAALVRWLFRGRLDSRFAWAAFAGSTIIVILCIALFFVASLDHLFSPALLSDLQAATTFGRMFKLALIYAALPEEAVKIGVVLLLLVLMPQRLRHASDPAQMLLYSALGFAMCESMLYVAGFATMSEFRGHLIVFAVARGIFGGLLHALLAMVAGFLLARQWRSRQKWIWAPIAYGAAALLHAAFDGSLLHLVFQEMAGGQSGVALSPGLSGSVVVFAACAVILLCLALLCLWRSRRLPT